MNGKESKRFRQLEARQVDLARVQKLQADATTELTAAVLDMKNDDAGHLALIRERNEARLESRRLERKLKASRYLNYAVLLMAISVLIMAIWATHDLPDTEPAAEASSVAVQVVQYEPAGI